MHRPFEMRLSCERFNQGCLLFAALWLLVTVPLGIILRPTIPDFGQFYVGGLVARQGEWSALYPMPVLGSLDNPGLNGHSISKLRWKALSRLHQVMDWTHFILPPPSALIFVPLSWLSYPHAFWVWTFVLSACTWGVAFIAGRLHRFLVKTPSRWEGAIALLIVLSPMTARAIRISNVSPPVAFLIGMTILDLVQAERPIRGAWAISIGALMKYATLILVPLLILMRRWRTLFWVCVFGAASVLLTLVLAGTEPFTEFFKRILPTLSRPSWYYGNQSLPGLLARLYGTPLSRGPSLVLNLTRNLSFVTIIFVLANIKTTRWREPPIVFASAGLLLSWLLIFSPIAWEHWPIFTCPIWGWLIYEARWAGVGRVLALGALILIYFPAGIIQVNGIGMFPVVLPEPFNSSQLLGMALLSGLAFIRVADAALTQTNDRLKTRVTQGFESVE